MWTKGTEWRTAIPSAVVHGSGPRNYSSTSWISRFWTATFIFLQFRTKKLSHRDFCMCLVRNLVAHAGSQPRPHKPLGRPPHASTKVGRLDSGGNKHWHVPSKPLRCRVCSSRGIIRKISWSARNVTLVYVWRAASWNITRRRQLWKYSNAGPN
jgi:hypothetical protein